MSFSEKRKRLISLASLLLITALASAALFYACYRYDNKYTAPGEQAVQGVLLLEEDDLERHPVIFLVRDWEIYRDKLLSPADFGENAPLPDELVFIGQYGGFEGSADSPIKRSPHGSATYRLNIFLPAETRSYTLELPEIYSAYRLYINGALMARMGEPSPESYRPQTGSRSVTVQAAGRMEILFAVSDYSYHYSGMVYPPAFGESEAAADMLNGRLALRSMTAAAALCIGLLNLCVWLLTRKGRGKNADAPLPLYHAALCVCFILYTCYPVVKTVLPLGIWWYTAENLAYCAMPLLVALIQRSLAAVPKKWFLPFIVLTAFACGWAVFVPLVRGDSLTLMMAYSGLIEFCAWAFALYLTVGAVYAVVLGAGYGKIMLAGIAVYDAALIMDRLFPLFEPIRFGWFNEIAGGILVLATGYVMAADMARKIRLRQAAESSVERVFKMLEVQRVYDPALSEKQREAETARHDLRHHIAVIRQLFSEDGEKLRAYLDAFEERRIAPAGLTAYCKHPTVNTLLGLYGDMAKGQETDFSVRAILPESLPVNDSDLCVVLSNLLENALEAVVRLPVEQRSVSVSIGCGLKGLGILVSNPFGGEIPVKDGRFLSSKRPGREGIGLESVRAVCEGYGGYANFSGDKNGTDGNGIFCSEAVFPLPESE